MQDEHGPLIRVEAAEAALELVPIEQAEVGSGSGASNGRRRGSRSSAARPLPCLAMAGVDQQPVQPGVERSGSRSPRMWRQAATSASWVASSAAASSRRISRATTKSRPIETRASSANAS